jgi:hypothetical protein
MSEQLGFQFDEVPSPVSGLALWREQRKAQIDGLASACGLPIGHAVRAYLISGILLEGRLQLAEPELWLDRRRSVELRLEIGGVDFPPTEIESCVRTD